MPVVFAGKVRGYAFVEYEHKADMKDAYKNADGLKVEGRRIVVDVERGRTVDGWYACVLYPMNSDCCCCCVKLPG